MAKYGASVPMTEIRDSFWDSFRDTLVREAIPYQWAALNDALPESAEKSGCMRLYSATGDERYLRLAAYFIRQRGRSPLFFEEEQLRFSREEAWKDSPLGMRYYQAHAPLTEQNEAVGHAVRAMYLYSGMADVAGATGDGELAAACGRLWESAVRRRMYVTGALGSSEHGEAFTFDYDLPNDTVYGEMRVWIRE